MSFAQRLLGVGGRLKIRLLTVVVVAIVALPATEATSLLEARSRAIAEAHAETDVTSRAMARQAAGGLRFAEGLLTMLREDLARSGPDDPGVRARLSQLSDLRSRPDLVVRGLRLVTGSGAMQGSGFGKVEAMLAPMKRDAVAIGDPMRDPADGIWVIPLATRAFLPGGAAAGYLVETLSVENLLHLYNAMLHGPRGSIALVRGDGMLLARWPELPRAVAHRPGTFHVAMQLTDHGSFDGVSSLDGTRRLGTVTRVPGLDIYVLVAMDRSEVLRAWRPLAAVHAGTVLAIVALLVLLARRLLRKVAEEENSKALLRESHAAMAASEARLQRANQWLQIAEQLAHVGHWVLDLGPGRRMNWSDEVYRISGRDPRSFPQDMNASISVVHPEDVTKLGEANARAVKRREPYEMHARILRPDGEERQVLVRGVPQIGPDGRVCAVFGMIADVTEQRRREAELLAAHEQLAEAHRELELANEKLETMAMQDALTGLANRRHFDRALQAEFRRAMRQGTALALVMIDVDQFKQFNDMYGHLAGDGALRAIAQAIPPLLNRPSDIVARYGGEEIALLLPGNDVPGGLEMAERIAGAVRGLCVVHAGSQHGTVTISAGVEAFVPVRDGLTPSDLVDHADRALYAAKRAGRDRRLSYASLAEATELGWALAERSASVVRVSGAA